MKKIDLGQTITIIANVGVISGIIFLALEIRQNNVFLESEARSSRAAIRRSAYSIQIENPELPRINNKNRSGQALMPEERAMMVVYWDFLFSGWQQGYGDYRAGLMELSEMRNIVEGVPFNRSPGMADHWQTTKARYDPEFAEWVDGIVGSGASR